MIRIVGDVCFSDGYFDIGFGIGSKLQSSYNPFEHLVFRKEDIWIGNLECVVSNISNKKGYKSLPFRIPYNRVTPFQHLDIYSVANNHIMQHGADAFEEMIDNVTKLGSQHIGSLNRKITRFNFKEKTFGLLAFSKRREAFSDNPLYWVHPEYNEIEIEIQKLKDCNFKIVYIHWGNEFIDYPNVEQKKFAHWLIDIGFDLVIGTHPHVMQGYEIYNDKYIFYSLGNFLFNMPTAETRHSAIVNIDIIDKELKISHNYVLINKNNQPVIVGAECVPKKFLFETLNKKISFEGDNEIYYKDMFQELSIYRHKNHCWMLKTLHKHSFKEIIFMAIDFLERRLKRRVS